MMNFTLLGDRILIQLDQAQDHTQTQSGLFIPLNKLTQTEGGRVTTELSGDKHLSQGTILQISSLSQEKLNEIKSDIKVGDKVYIVPSIKNTSNYHFYPDRTRQVQDFDGVICIPHSLIEAKLND